MKQSLRRNTVLILIALSTIFFGCTKEDKCEDPLNVDIEHNGPIVAGWRLNLEANYASTGYLYKWSGPNGWKMEYNTFASDAYQQSRENVTMADGGEYKLQMVDPQGCVAYEGSAIVEVIPAPAPACTIAANTSTSSVVGVGDYTFIYKNFSGGSGFYIASGSQTNPGGDFMRFAFHGDNPPLPGIYKTFGYFGTEPGKVGLYIRGGAYDFVASPDQTVYVNKVNNKLEITFCSLKFNNPLNPANPFTVSAKLVQP